MDDSAMKHAHEAILEKSWGQLGGTSTYVSGRVSGISASHSCSAGGSAAHMHSSGTYMAAPNTSIVFLWSHPKSQRPRKPSDLPSVNLWDERLLQWWAKGSIDQSSDTDSIFLLYQPKQSVFQVQTFFI
jgi:hypothetical protein